MALLVMPVRSDLPAYSFTMELEQANYRFKFRFNSRMSRWFMDIQDTDETDIITGIPMLTGTDLLSRFVDDNLPPGQFICLDETGAGKNATRYDFGEDVKLLYREST